MEAYECQSVNPDAANGSIWACSLQGNETVILHWQPPLITSSCSRALLGKQTREARTPFPQPAHAQKEVRDQGRPPSLCSSSPTHPFFGMDGFVVGGPAGSRRSKLPPYQVSCLNMSTATGKSFFMLKAEAGVCHLQNPS